MENTMTNRTEIEPIKNDVLTAAQILICRGLCEAFGHVSARIPGTDHIIITPKSSMVFAKTPDDLCVIDLDGNIVAGNKKPPLEAWLHTCIYRRRNDVGAIARTHSFTTSAFSTLGESVKPVHDFGAILLKETPVFQDSRLIETRELGKKLANFINDDGTAVLLRGNGTAVLGKHVMEATIRAVYLEESAMLQFKARQMGTPIYFSEEETRQRGQQLLEVSHIQRAWDHYKNEAPSAG
jgi:L-fuculose-phosphate aldolase